MLLTEILRRQLTHYYYGDYCQRDYPVDEQDIRRAKKPIEKLVEGMEPDTADALRCGITEIGSAYELQGFLRGYEYCLKMLNLLEGKERLFDTPQDEKHRL